MPNSRDADVLLLEAAADPIRLAILRRLSIDGPSCAGEFKACGADLSQPTISHHLKVLREAGWVQTERRGRRVWYDIDVTASARFARIAAGIGRGRVGTVDIPSPPRVAGRERPPEPPAWRQW